MEILKSFERVGRLALGSSCVGASLVLAWMAKEDLDPIYGGLALGIGYTGYAVAKPAFEKEGLTNEED